MTKDVNGQKKTISAMISSMDTLDALNILRMSKRLTTGPVIYFLINKEEIVYVGQTRCLFTRLGTHRRKIKFDSYAYITASSNKMEREALEGVYIRKFYPKYNLAGLSTTTTPRLSTKQVDKIPKAEKSPIVRKRIAFHVSNRHKGSCIDCPACLASGL